MKTSFANPAHSAGAAAEVSTPPLKILVVVEPGIAGAFGHVEGLVRYLVGRNQRVYLAYSSKRTGPRLAPLIEWVVQHGGKSLDLRVGNAPCPGDASAFLRLRSFAREIQPDVIHSHSSKAGVLARMLALSGIKSRQIYTPHAYYGLAARAGLRNALYNGVERFFGRIGQTIAVSEDERNFAVETLKIDAERCWLIPVAVDTDKFLPASAEARQRARAELGLPGDAVILGWMGRLSFQKDPPSLLHAFARIDQKTNPCHLLLVGHGEEKEAVDRLVLELGLVPHLTRIPSLDDSRKFYEAIDGLILTSRYEACPTVVIEALSADLPLILRRAPGTHWLGRHNLSHLWYAPSGDAPGLAEAITQWQADLPARRPGNHRALALQRFSIPHVYRTILEAYRGKAPAGLS